MSRIIFESTGPAYRVPGLPYHDPFTHSRAVTYDTVPSPADLEALMASITPPAIPAPWSLDALKGMREYIPTTFRRVTERMPRSLFEDLFGPDTSAATEEERTLLQLQTEIETKSSTIDAGIIHARSNLGTVVNKVQTVNRLYLIGRTYGFLDEREYPILFGDLEDPRRWPDVLSEVKQEFMRYVMEVPVGKRSYRARVRTANLSQKERAGYPYLEWLERKLGDDLVGVLLYGSAARTDDPAKFSDYDNWIVVRNVARAHQALKGTSPSVIDGKVVEGVHERDVSAKHLGIHIIPEDDRYLTRFIRFLHDSKEFRKHTRVLLGEFRFPYVSPDEVVERGVSQAYVKLKSVLGSLNWPWVQPERLVKSQNLYEYFVKNLRFFLQHSLNAIEEQNFRDKETQNKLLAQRGMAVPEFRPDADYIRSTLVRTCSDVLTLQQELQQKRPHGDFSFLRTPAPARYAEVPEGSPAVPALLPQSKEAQDAQIVD